MVSVCTWCFFRKRVPKTADISNKFLSLIIWQKLALESDDVSCLSDDYQVTNVQITFINEKLASSSGSAEQVTYKVTATQGSKQVDVKSVKASVHQTIMDAHLTGVTVLSSSQQQAFDSSSDNLDNQASGQGGNDQTTDSQGTNQSQSQNESGTSSGDQSGSVVQGSDQTQAQNNGVDSKKGDHTMQTTDSVLLTYKNTQQRDNLLQQILAVWKTALSMSMTKTSEAQGINKTFFEE